MAKTLTAHRTTYGRYWHIAGAWRWAWALELPGGAAFIDYRPVLTTADIALHFDQVEINGAWRRLLRGNGLMQAWKPLKADYLAERLTPVVATHATARSLGD